MPTLLRVTLAATFLYGLLAVGVFALTDPALSAEAPSQPGWPADIQPGDIDRNAAEEKRALRALTQPPTDQAAPKGNNLNAAPTTCLLLLARVTELKGWRVLTGAKAQKYINTAFAEHPPADTVAFATAGDVVGLLMAIDGCVVGRRIMPARAHKRIMEAAFGIVA